MVDGPRTPSSLNTTHPKSHAYLFLAAVAGLHLLALAMLFGLFCYPVLALVLKIDLPAWPALVSLGSGVLALMVLFVHRDRFIAPGLRITEKDQPRLFEEIRGTALSLGQKIPDEIYLSLRSMPRSPIAAACWATEGGG